MYYCISNINIFVRMTVFQGWNYGETSGEYGDGGNDMQMDGECEGAMSKGGGNPFGSQGNLGAEILISQGKIKCLTERLSRIVKEKI